MDYPSSYQPWPKRKLVDDDRRELHVKRDQPLRMRSLPER